MSSPFAITTSSSTVSLDGSRQGQTSFTVTNTTPQPIQSRARLWAQPTSALAWLNLQGNAERSFASGQSQQYVVQVTVPPSAPTGDYTFRLDLVDEANPDENFSQGPAVKFTVAAPAPVEKRSVFPWWIVAVVLGALILLGGGIYALIPKSPSGSSLAPTATAQTHLNATATVQALSNATATAQATNANPYPPHTGTLVLNDPMKDNSRGYKWDEATLGTNGSCGFSGGTYHVTTLKAGIILTCEPEASSLVFSNLTFEATVKVVQGTQGGVAIRVNQQQGVSYIFAIDIQGHYYLYRQDNLNTAPTVIIQGTNRAIVQGLNQSNTLAIVANGHSMFLYVNGQYIDQGTDSSYTQGQIGLYAGGNSDVAVTSARVWQM